MTLSLSPNNGPPEMLLKNWMDLILGAFLLTVEHVFRGGRERIDVCVKSLSLYIGVSPPRLTSFFNALKSSASKESLQRMRRSMESGGTNQIPAPEKKRFNLLIRAKVTRAIGSVSHNFMRNSTQNKSLLAFPEEKYICCFITLGGSQFCFIRYKLLRCQHFFSDRILSYSRSSDCIEHRAV